MGKDAKKVKEDGINHPGLTASHEYFSSEKSLDPASRRRAPALRSGPIPSSPPNLGGEKDADEGRLFYVALTRAKESVTITHAREDETHRETLPSVFIEEIRSDLVENIDTQIWEKKFTEDKQFQFLSSGRALGSTSVEPKALQGSIRDIKFVRELFEKQGLSPTALNNYLQCPWKYFYQNLIRIPAAQTIHQLYGIAVHGALQDFFKRMKEEESTKEFLLESYKRHLYRLPVAPTEIENLLVKGNKALSGWFDTYKGTWEANVLTEFRINGVLLDSHPRGNDNKKYGNDNKEYDNDNKKNGNDTTQIKLTGVLDKIEFIDGDIVNVVDYKTGKAKTRNELEGKTKNADGNYYRQLVFYKLLLNLFNDGKYSMQSGTLEFIEPDDKSKYHREVFEINNEQVEILKEKIRKVADEIINLSFWNKKCDDKDCEFCKLRNLMSY